MMCGICEHPKQKKIERRIKDGFPIKDIALEFDLGRNVISRHKAHSGVRELMPIHVANRTWESVEGTGKVLQTELMTKEQAQAYVSSLDRVLLGLHKMGIEVVHDAKELLAGAKAATREALAEMEGEEPRDVLKAKLGLLEMEARIIKLVSETTSRHTRDIQLSAELDLLSRQIELPAEDTTLTMVLEVEEPTE